MNEHYSIDCVGMYGILCYPMELGYNNPGRSTHDIASGWEGGGGLTCHIPWFGVKSHGFGVKSHGFGSNIMVFGLKSC